MNDRELLEALVEHAYLEGDFVLRSGKRSRYYLDKYRFETRPELLRPLGERIAATVREHAADAHGLQRRSSGPSRSQPPPRSTPGCPSSSCERRRKSTGPGTGSRARTTPASASASS